VPFVTKLKKLDNFSNYFNITQRAQNLNPRKIISDVNLSEEDVHKILYVLESQKMGIETLQEVMEREKRDVKIMKKEISAMHN